MTMMMTRGENGSRWRQQMEINTCPYIDDILLEANAKVVQEVSFIEEHQFTWNKEQVLIFFSTQQRLQNRKRKTAATAETLSSDYCYQAFEASHEWKKTMQLERMYTQMKKKESVKEFLTVKMSRGSTACLAGSNQLKIATTEEFAWTQGAV